MAAVGKYVIYQEGEYFYKYMLSSFIIIKKFRNNPKLFITL